MCAYRPSPTSSLSGNSQSITNCQLPIARLLDSIHHRPLPPTAINSKHFIPQQSFGIPPEKNSWQLFPFGSAAGQKEMLFVRLNRTGGPSFTVKCAIVRDYIVGRHKSFCVNSLHHNTPSTIQHRYKTQGVEHRLLFAWIHGIAPSQWTIFEVFRQMTHKSMNCTNRPFCFGSARYFSSLRLSASWFQRQACDL